MADTVTLLSNDDKSFEISQEAIDVSVTIKELIEDIGDLDAPIPLPNVSGETLARVVEYCNYHYAISVSKEDETAVATETAKEIELWDEQFCKMELQSLFQLILAANYLEIPSLLDVTCKTVANMINGKTPDQIRETFNIPDDLTEEQKEEMYKEYREKH